MKRAHGPRRTPEGWSFSVWAPKVPSLKLRLDGRDVPMVRDNDGFHTATVKDAKAGSRYALVLDENRVRPDPATRRQPDGVHAASQLFDPSAFRWTDSAFKGHALKELIIYELHVGTFTDEATFDAAAKALPELVELGVTLVELMPVQPFPGARNWGYDGVAMYGVHEAYGGPEGLQRFVDRAHALGLSVALDVVYNHMGPEGNYLGELAPYFTSRHRSPWGDGMNYDGEDAKPARRFVIDAALQWFRDFHIDALRLDAVHAIPDDSEKHLLAELSDEVAVLSKEVGRPLHLIAESDLNDRKLVEPTPKGWGMSTVWADDLHHSLHALLTGERGHFYKDFGEWEHLRKALAEGFVYQGQQSPFRGKPHGTPTKGLPPTAFVTCAQNHDQVGNRPRGERLSTLVPKEALPAIAATYLLGAGLPMIFMGEERGETRPFLYFTSHSDPGLAKAVSEGRKAEFIASGGHGDVPDPQSEETFQSSKLQRPGDEKLRATYRELIALRKRHLDEISRWPEVTLDGTVVTLRRPGLDVQVNLGPKPQGGLPAWGYRVGERIAK
ncbi:MAG: malto-oligosyltrehalose trehalohydrolase [Myxococcaceae bacterium]